MRLLVFFVCPRLCMCLHVKIYLTYVAFARRFACRWFIFLYFLVPCFNCSNFLFYLLQVVPAWLNCLPIKGDLIEAKVVHDQLCSMVERYYTSFIYPFGLFTYLRDDGKIWIWINLCFSNFYERAMHFPAIVSACQTICCNLFSVIFWCSKYPVSVSLTL